MTEDSSTDERKLAPVAADPTSLNPSSQPSKKRTLDDLGATNLNENEPPNKTNASSSNSSSDGRSYASVLFSQPHSPISDSSSNPHAYDTQQRTPRGPNANYNANHPALVALRTAEQMILKVTNNNSGLNRDADSSSSMGGIIVTQYRGPNLPPKYLLMISSIAKYTITVSKDKPIPSQLDPAYFPNQLVVFRKNALIHKNNAMMIDPVNITPLTEEILTSPPGNEVMACFSAFFGKTMVDRDGTVFVVLLQYSCANGNLDSFLNWQKMHPTNNQSDIRFPVSTFVDSAAALTPCWKLDSSCLISGEIVRFSLYPNFNGTTYATNLQRVTQLTQRNTVGTPPYTVPSIIETLPNGKKIDTHFSKNAIIPRGDLCTPLLKDVTALISKNAPDQDSLITTVYIHATQANSDFPNCFNEITTGELHCATLHMFRLSWWQVSLHQIVEAFCYIKKKYFPAQLARLPKNGTFTLVYLPTNQNILPLITQQVQDSFNVHGKTGHKYLNKKVGAIVLVKLQNAPANEHVAPLNPQPIFSKYICPYLACTSTSSEGYNLPLGYELPSVHFKSASLPTTHCYVTLLAFADTASYLPFQAHLTGTPDKICSIPTDTTGNTMITVILQKNSPTSGAGTTHSLISSSEFQRHCTLHYPYGTGPPEDANSDRLTTVYVYPNLGKYNMVWRLLRETALLQKQKTLICPLALQNNSHSITLRSKFPSPDEMWAVANRVEVDGAYLVSPHMLRVILRQEADALSFLSGIGFKLSPVQSCGLQAITHSHGNSPWVEVYAAGIFSNLGHSSLPLPPGSLNGLFLGGFIGAPSADWTQTAVIQRLMNSNHTIASSLEESQQPNKIVVKVYKPTKAGALGISATETILHLSSLNPGTTTALKELANHVATMTNNTIFPLGECDGLEHLSLLYQLCCPEEEDVQASANDDKFEDNLYSLLETSSTAQNKASTQPPATTQPNVNVTPQQELNWSITGHQKRTKHPKTGKKPRNAKPGTTPASDRANVFLNVISEDEEEEPTDEVEVQERLQDAGDFNTNQDQLISSYLTKHLNGAGLSSSALNKIISTTVPWWTALYPDYHSKAKLALNFTGKDSGVGPAIVNALSTNSSSTFKDVLSTLKKALHSKDKPSTVVASLTALDAFTASPSQPSDYSGPPAPASSKAVANSHVATPSPNKARQISHFFTPSPKTADSTSPSAEDLTQAEVSDSISSTDASSHGPSFHDDDEELTDLTPQPVAPSVPTANKDNPPPSNPITPTSAPCPTPTTT